MGELCRLCEKLIVIDRLRTFSISIDDSEEEDGADPFVEFRRDFRCGKISYCCFNQCNCVETLKELSPEKHPEAKLYSLFDTCRKTLQRNVSCCKWNTCKCADDKIQKVVDQGVLPVKFKDAILDVHNVKPVQTTMLRNLRPVQYVDRSDSTVKICRHIEPFSGFLNSDHCAIVSYHVQEAMRREMKPVHMRALYELYADRV